MFQKIENDNSVINPLGIYHLEIEDVSTILINKIKDSKN